MATSVTQSLFGMSPQAIQAQRAADLNAQALQYAQLNPTQAARAGAFRAGSLFGDAAAGAMGYEDPEIAQAKQMQGMLGGADMNDPDSLMQIAQRIQSVNPAAAQELAQRAMTMRKTQVETQAKEAEMMRLQQGYQMRYEGLKSRHPDMTDEVARSLADDPPAFREAMKSDKVVKETAEGVFVVDKNNPEDKIRIGDPVDRRSVTNVNVDARTATGVAKLVNDFETSVKPAREAYNNARTAQNLINESLGSDNSQAWEQARTSLAKANNQGRLNVDDIRRTGIDPRYVQGVLDWVNKKTAGVPNEDIQRQLFTVAKILERDAEKEINRVAERMRAVGAAENLDPDKLGVYFPGVEGTGTPRGTVNWSDLK
jgi:hypothetical protein